MHAFRERVALVTGSTGEGMGRSIALTLAREGARVALNYGTGHPNNVIAADKVLTEIRAIGGKGYAFKADTRNEDEVAAMVKGIFTLYGRIDFLVCNAGGTWEMKDLPELDGAHWRSVISAELDGLFYCIRPVLPMMRKSHFGRIIAVSVAGAERWNGPPFDYVAGKSARNSFVRSLAGQEISNGITCNIVAPGKTPHVTLKQAVDAAKHGGNWKRRTHAVPQDVADVVRFLCSEEASFVTGNVIELSGS